MVDAKIQRTNETSTFNQLDQREPKKKGELAGQLISIPLKEEDRSKVQLKTLLSDEEEVD